MEGNDGVVIFHFGAERDSGVRTGSRNNVVVLV
jgi:hypothetical protein